MIKSCSPSNFDSPNDEAPKSSSQERLPWTEICCPSSGKRNVHASIVYKHYIITFGGGDGRLALNDFIVLDMDTFTWQKVEPLGVRPTARFGHSICNYKNNSMIVYGGNNQTALNETAIMTVKSTQPFTIEWRVVKTTNGDKLYRYWHTAHVLEDYMYLFGGTDRDKEASNQLWRLDLDNFNWERCSVSGDIPCERSGHGSVLYQGKLYVIGGYADTVCLDDIYMIDISSSNRVWQRINASGLSPGPRASTCLQERNGEVYLFGGQIPGEYYNDLFVYNIEKNNWRQIETKNKSPSERSCYSAVIYDDLLVIWGGFRGTCATDIFYIPLPSPLHGKSGKQEKKHRRSNYQQHMRELLHDKLHSDISFEVDGRRFAAHKNILSARCKYFRNMFESKMKESKEMTFQIPDVSQETFEAFLEFVYCDTINLTDELALELLTISNKWLFVDLKEECELFLSSKINLENFVRIGNVAEKFEASGLMGLLCKFGAQNFDVLEEKGVLLDMSKSVLVGIMKEINKKG